MNEQDKLFYRKLITSLAIVSAIAGLLLAITYGTTNPVIKQREKEDQVKALQNVFFLQKQGKEFKLTTKDLGNGVTALYEAGKTDKPAYYAALGKGIGYNSSVPVSLMVGFTGPAEKPATLLKGYVPEERLPQTEAAEPYIVGFSVVNSEETPGLGEKIKDAKPPFTWGQFLTGHRPPPSLDHATPFQSQFRGRLAGNLVLKKNGGDLDAITASTMTSNGVVAALRDASGKLQAALAK